MAEPFPNGPQIQTEEELAVHLQAHDEKLRAEGYRRGLEDALNAAIDEARYGSETAMWLREALAHVKAHGTLPGGKA